MSRSTSLGYLFSGTAALALLAACSAGGGALAPSTSSAGSSLQSIASAPSIVSVTTTSNAQAAGQVIVSDGGNNTVTVFDAGGHITTTLSSQDGLLNPQGITTDRSGTLYVPNEGNSNVLIFPKPYKTASKTLQVTGYSPSDVALDPSTGNVAVINNESTSFGAGEVAIFKKGSTKPCATVIGGSSGLVYFDYGAFDKLGNLYVAGEDSQSNVIVGVATGGCKASSVSKLTVGNAISYPGGIQVLKSGKILIADQGSDAIYTYAPPTNGSLGSPTATTPLDGVSDPVTFAITASGDLWVVDRGQKVAAKFNYPAGGSPIQIHRNNFSSPDGIAVNPAQMP